MTLTYRTAGPWGAGKGANLSPEEVDGNVYDHELRIVDLETNPPEVLYISNVTQAGVVVTFHRSDATEFPVTLPRAVAETFVEEISETEHTLALDDTGTYFRCTNAAGCTITIPNEEDVDFPIRTEIHFRQCAAGPVVIVGDSNVIINGIDGYEDQTDKRGAVITVKKVGEETWDLFGLLALAEEAESESASV